METTLAILMVLGIFVGIPAAIGFAIAGVYVLGTRRRAVRGDGKALGEQPAEIGGEALLKRA